MEKVVLDTNILIEILKGNQKIISKLEHLDITYCISSITAMELFYGALNKQELLKLKKFITLFEVIQLNEKISIISTDLIFKYSKSHNLAIADSLIASTCISENISLYTLNLKDFKFIQDLNLLK